MFSKSLSIVIAANCLFYLFMGTESSFIKPNNVPRVGRSNEVEDPFGDSQGVMAYVIKTNKNIPRIGRRNFDSDNRFDIPKFYQLPVENAYEDGEGKEQIENYYQRLPNMK